MPKNIKISGIYIITSLVSRKHYIGESENTSKRLRKHLSCLRRNCHPNAHLQDSFNKYGEKNFTFELLTETEDIFRKSEENYWCNLLNTHNREYGYNIQPTSPYGMTGHSVETRKKIGISNKGIGAGIKKPPFSDETRRKISESKIGNTASKGIKRTFEFKERLRNLHKGKMYHLPVKHSEETKKKLSEMKKGKPLSEQHKAALREANRKYHENKIKLGKI